MGYSRTFGSRFPGTCIKVGTRKDVDDSVADVIRQYNACLSNGSLNDAAVLYEQNKTLLEPYMLDMAYINRLEEEIYNTGIYAMYTASSVISAEQPAEQNTGGYWLSDY